MEFRIITLGTGEGLLPLLPLLLLDSSSASPSSPPSSFSFSVFSLFSLTHLSLAFSLPFFDSSPLLPLRLFFPSTISLSSFLFFLPRSVSPLILICCQVFTTITFDAVAIGVIFQRLSRVQKRARTIVFSDKAVIRRIRGRLFFMFQLSELRKHQLVEAHVRVYCVRHEREGQGKVGGDGPKSSFGTTRHRGTANKQSNASAAAAAAAAASASAAASSSSSSSSSPHGDRYHVETAYFQTHNVRLQHPDDELGSLLLMALPNVVVHRIDEWSPLHAPAVWYDEKGRRHVWRGMKPPNVTGEVSDDEPADEGEDGDAKFDGMQRNRVVAGFPGLLQVSFVRKFYYSPKSSRVLFELAEFSAVLETPPSNYFFFLRTERAFPPPHFRVSQTSRGLQRSCRPISRVPNVPSRLSALPPCARKEAPLCLYHVLAKQTDAATPTC